MSDFLEPHGLKSVGLLCPWNFPGKNTWSELPFPSPYTVEVTERLKGLDLVNRMPEELWTEVYNTLLYTGGSEQNHPKEKEIQGGKVII